MKYIIPLFIIISLLCGINSFDMKYSLTKDFWHEFSITDGSIDKDSVESDDDNYGVWYTGKGNRLLKSTVLAGGVLLTDSYLIFADFQINHTISSCLFSMERKEKPKLALCLQPAGNDAVTLTLDAANIPDGKISFGHKIENNQRIKLIVSVKSTGVTLLKDCAVIEEKRFNSNISDQIHLTDEMELVLAKHLPSEPKLMITLNKLDLYSPIDATTLMTLCPDLLPSQFRGERGEKGDKGAVGERGIGMVGLKGDRGETGSKGDKGDVGRRGLVGPPGTGIKGDRGVSGAQGARGLPGAQGEPGLPGIPGAVTNCPASTDEHDALMSIAAGMKLLSDYIIEKTETNSQCNERLTKAEHKIEALSKAMIAESQF